MRICVVGHSGMLGSAVSHVAAVNHGHEVSGVSRHGIPAWSWLTGAVSLNERSLYEAVDSLVPDVVINCAALTSVDRAQQAPWNALEANCELPRRLAQMARTAEFRLVHISTDAVFDGTVEDPPHAESAEPRPVNVYAATKAYAERLLADERDVSIVRCNMFGWSPGPEPRGLAEWALANWAEGSPIGGFADVIFNPLLTTDLAATLVRLSTDNNTAAVLHAAAPNPTTKYDFLRMLARSFGYPSSFVRPATLDGANLTAPRPKNTALRPSENLGAFRSLEEAVDVFKESRGSPFASEIHAATSYESF